MRPDEEAHRISVDVADDDPYSPDVTIGRVVRAGKWESMIPNPTGGETDSGSTGDATSGETSGAATGTGGSDSLTGGDSDTPTGGGSDTPATQNGPGGETTDTAGTGGSGSDTVGSTDEGGCACRSQDPGAGASLRALALLGLRRRRRA